MPLNEWLVAEVRSWMRKAEEDLQAGEACLHAKRPLSAVAAFHAQQAVEKALKAFLTLHQQPFAKTHHLLEVGRPCWTIDPSLEPTVLAALPLSEFAWKHRYPGKDPDPTREEAWAVLRLAQAVFERILERLPAEVRP